MLIDELLDSEDDPAYFNALATPQRKLICCVGVISSAGLHIAHNKPQFVEVFSIRRLLKLDRFV